MLDNDIFQGVQTPDDTIYGTYMYDVSLINVVDQ